VRAGRHAHARPGRRGHRYTPHAFATDHAPSHAVLCATTGLAKHLTDDEIEAVLARELSRLAHRDVIVITIASLMPVFAGLLLRIPFHTAPRGGPDWQTSPTSGAEPIALVPSVYVLGLAADRAGATLTGQPSSLAHALIKSDITGTVEPLGRRSASGPLYVVMAW
jgi:heat shock protein HtpX